MKLEKYTLLFVEDNQYLLDEYADFLKLFFKEIHTASSGKDALRIYKEQNPDIIITDINMANMNGLDLIKKIREDDFQTLIIALSAYSDQEKLISASQLELLDYLVKPINTSDLIVVLQKLSKRLEKREKEQIIRINQHYTWDKRRLKLFDKNNNDIFLQGREINLIHFFCTNNVTRVYSVEEILYAIWSETIVNKETASKLRVLISLLNKRLEHPLFKSKYLVGYSFIREEEPAKVTS